MKRLLSATLLSALITCQLWGQDPRGLKEHYKNYFPIGVAIGPGNLQGDEQDLILKHFNSITAENVMKMGPIHPSEERYVWEHADALADFARKHNLQMRGHTLCWHNQVAPWFFRDHNGDTVSSEVLLQRLKDHITTVVSRYKGTIYAWDVVNEVIDDGEAFYRNSAWYRICGESFIEKAFEYAHDADPNALLFYNDYNTYAPAKRDKIIQMIKGLMDKGVPIHGIGLQGHWSIYGPDEEQLREALDAYATLGLPIHITELDVSVYPPEHSRRDKRPEDNTTFTPEMEQRQVEQYKMFFRVFRDYREVIKSVTFWNLSDRHSWLDNFPVRDRKNYPLLFDKNLAPKKAYWEVVRFE